MHYTPSLTTYSLETILKAPVLVLTCFLLPPSIFSSLFKFRYPYSYLLTSFNTLLIFILDIDIDLLFLLHLHFLHYCYVLLGTAWPDHATIQHSSLLSLLRNFKGKWLACVFGAGFCGLVGLLIIFFNFI